MIVKLVTLKVRRDYQAKNGRCIDRLCTHDAGLVFRNKNQWWADKARLRAARTR